VKPVKKLIRHRSSITVADVLEKNKNTKPHHKNVRPAPRLREKRKQTYTYLSFTTRAAAMSEDKIPLPLTVAIDVVQLILKNKSIVTGTRRLKRGHAVTTAHHFHTTPRVVGQVLSKA
jgi:hypothetical protein